jgi:hypothetical protein
MAEISKPPSFIMDRIGPVFPVLKASGLIIENVYFPFISIV